MADFTRLQQEVAEDADVKSSAATLLRGLADRVRATAGDTAKANELADALDASSNDLAAAVAESTVAEDGGSTEGGGGGGTDGGPTEPPTA